MRRLFPAGVVVAIALASFAPVVSGVQAAHAATNTIVSLTFDDGVADQAIAEAAMDAHGMHGTFYVNTNTINTGGYLSWAQLTQFAAAGHEIGGHTLDHLDLTTIPVAQAQTQVCQDRAEPHQPRLRRDRLRVPVRRRLRHGRGAHRRAGLRLQLGPPGVGPLQHRPGLRERRLRLPVRGDASAQRHLGDPDARQPADRDHARRRSKPT